MTNFTNFRRKRRLPARSKFVSFIKLVFIYNTTLIGFDYMPIWCVFPQKVATKMKLVITAFYKGKKSLIDLSHFGIVGVEK